LERTQKIFYVCCTRAKENLAVFYHNPNTQVVSKAREWFGEQNVINLEIKILCPKRRSI
jgi:DNA helicase-2/ATP-dependent DNA helicase PcrA